MRVGARVQCGPGLRFAVAGRSSSTRAAPCPCVSLPPLAIVIKSQTWPADLCHPPRVSDPRRWRSCALLLGLLPGALVVGLSACSHAGAVAGGATTSSTGRVVGTATAASNHEAEIAADQAAVKAALPAPSDIKWGSVGFTTGTDTPDGWQVQNQHDDITQKIATTGSRQVQIVCAGRGSLQVSISVRAADGAQVSQPVTSAPCSPEATTSWTSFSVAEGDQGIDVIITPDADTVAAAGYTVT